MEAYMADSERRLWRAVLHQAYEDADVPADRVYLWAQQRYSPAA